jgi:hypothetical protein
MTLTAQQEQAMKMIKEFIADKDSQVFILKGYAGTGKTTLIRTITEYLQTKSLSAQLMAPTGRAAKVLRSKIPKHGASTIHRGIYEFSHIVIEESEGTLKYIFPLRDNQERGIYIIDEASMVSSRKSNSELFQFGTGVLIDDLLSYARLNFGGKIIFVGDPMQLPPVGDNHSMALDEAYFGGLDMNVFSYKLTDIVRQDKDSTILTNATMLRELIKKEERNHLVFEKKEGEVMDIGTMEVAKQYCEASEESAAIICFSNQQAADYNTAIRKILFPKSPHVAVGDKLMVVCNSYYDECELLNGDIITVVETSDNIITQSAPVWTELGGKKTQVIITLEFKEIKFQAEEGYVYSRYIISTLLQNKQPSLTLDEMKALYINMVMRLRTDMGLADPRTDEFIAAIGQDPFYNALQVKYGYAFTCHKSQGGEWNTVYVDFMKRTGLDTDSLRWKYTAITRAAKRMWCVNLPNVTPLSNLKVNPINRTAKFANNALSFDNVEDTPFHSASALPSVKSKYWSVTKNMDGTQYSIKSIISKPWRDIYEVNTPSGVVRVDAIYNGAGIFTKYEVKENDAELLLFFQNDENVRYKIEYQTSLESLGVLHNRMISLCDECEISLTNVVEGHYQLVYYMRASGNYASITFFFNGKGFINYAAPLSDIGEADEKLVQLIKELCQ